MVQCGSGYNVAPPGVTSVLNVIQQGHGGTVANLTITNTENFPGPAVGASDAEVLCIQNQKLHGNAMPLPNQLVTGFFASPVRNCSGGYVMSYNPCTKEIKYNASKTADGILDVDVGDCYSEYLYWDDGLGTTYAGNPGWKIGGTSLAGSDNGRVHIGCRAGEQEGASAAPAVGARAANLTIAIGLEAGQYGLGRFDNGAVPAANDNRGNIAIGYQSGWDRMYPRSVAIGYQAGRVRQGGLGTPDERLDGAAGNVMDSNVAIGNYAGENTQYIGSIAVGANAGRDAQRQFALAIGLQAGRTQQGFHALALGHMAGCSMPARAGIFPAGTFDAQSANSIIVNAGDPKNAGVLESDWGPLQAISGSSSACGATINAAGTGYAIGVATTTTAGAGHGFVINIMAVGPAPLNDIITFGIVSCGSGYAALDTVTVTGGNNNAVLLLNDGEIFPAPAAGASTAEIACIRNQGNQVDMPTSAGQPVTGFFVNPVRNVGGGFVMAYDPCTKEIKYNASKAIGDLPVLDDGDCYSEYLYWDDGLGTAYAGDPGWKVGGGPLDPSNVNPDRGRVHIGCGAGQYQAAGNPGTRAGQRTVAVGFNAGNIAMSDNATAIGENAGALNQGPYAVAVGSLAGSTNQSERGVAIGHRAGQSVQGVDSVAVGFEAGQSNQGTLSVALGAQAGTSGQATESVAIGSLAGQIGQQLGAIAIGRLAGRTTQGELGIAIGYGAGGSVQGAGSIAVGDRAGQVDQGTNCIAIGSRSGGNANGAGQFSQQTLSVAIGHFCGHTQQGIAAAGGAGSCVAIGSSCSSTQQGANSIAIGYEAGQSSTNTRTGTGGGVFPAGPHYQIVNSIVLNSGDPKNAGVDATNDHGPLQAIAGSSNFCNVASILTPGADYVVGGATTSTALPGNGPGSGMVVNITSVAAGGVTGVTITDCGTGYTGVSVIVLIQPGSNNLATISVDANEAFPPPNAGASSAAAACVNNQGNNDNMPLPGAQATGFFVNPVRNCSGGFVMSYNPCTKEIKYNASKLTDHLADFDLQGADCYSEYLYWDDGLGTAHAGDPGWKVGGGPQDGAANPDRGRVHLGCGAGQFQTIAGTAGTRAGQQSVAVGFKAGNVGMSDYNIAVGGSAAEYRQGWDNVASSAVADARSIAIGNEAAQTQQGARTASPWDTRRVKVYRNHSTLLLETLRVEARRAFELALDRADNASRLDKMRPW